jgi:hypothetical protein
MASSSRVCIPLTLLQKPPRVNQDNYRKTNRLMQPSALTSKHPVRIRVVHHLSTPASRFRTATPGKDKDPWASKRGSLRNWLRSFPIFSSSFVILTSNNTGRWRETLQSQSNPACLLRCRLSIHFLTSIIILFGLIQQRWERRSSLRIRLMLFL